MALSEAVKDKLTVLCVMADALNRICASAVDNADSDSAQDDVMVKATRRQFLTLKSIGSDFLTVAGTPAVRKSFAALQGDANLPQLADVNYDGPDATTLTKWKSLCFENGATIADSLEVWGNTAAL